MRKVKHQAPVSVDFGAFRQYFEKVADIPAAEWEVLCSKMKILRLRKGSLLLKQGEICKSFYFVVRGGVRMYYINDSGSEATYDFVFEHQFFTAVSSFIKQQPSNENIVSIEDAVLLIIKVRDFQDLLRRHVCWHFFFGDLLVRLFLKKSERERMFLLDDPVTRYRKVFTFSPYLFQRVEQKHIASYLGMAAETFSRVKRRVFEKGGCGASLASGYVCR